MVRAGCRRPDCIPTSRCTRLRPAAEPYAPRGELWADGADKKRWVMLPLASRIDTSDMDDWVYPPGTKVWKEFSLNGRRIETRLIEKLSSGAFRMVAYQWNADQSDADAVPLGVEDADGTDHDIPDMEACKQCHEGRADRLLGFSAVQLAQAQSGLTLSQLIADGRLSAPPATALALPGDATEQTALAYLHANCGHCHNRERKRADREISVYFWQEATALDSVQQTVSYRSLVADKKLPLWVDAVLTRMQSRGGVQQMPPLGTESVDVAGVTAVDAWMKRLRAQFAAEPALPEVRPRRALRRGRGRVRHLRARGLPERVLSRRRHRRARLQHARAAAREPRRRPRQR